MQYLEKDFQTEFCKWAKYRLQGSAAVELKLARGNALPFSALQEHQANALRLSKHQKIVHKIPDSGYQNPFDCFILSGVQAFIAVQFLDTSLSHRPKTFYLIDIDIWEREAGTSQRKSLTEDRASKIGEICTLA